MSDGLFDFEETYYNLGRAMHQMNLLPAAIHYYNRVLATKVIIMRLSYYLVSDVYYRVSGKRV